MELLRVRPVTYLARPCEAVRLPTPPPALSLSWRCENQKRSGGVGLRYFIYSQEYGRHSVNVADPEPGCVILCLFDSGILNRFFPDPGSQIHIFT